MNRFLLSQFPGEPELSSNIVRWDVVLALDLLERHARLESAAALLGHASPFIAARCRAQHRYGEKY
jgi:hypothetical protein